MNHFRPKTTGIGTRLGGAFGALTLLLLACAAFGVLRLNALNGSMQTLLSHEARASALSAELVAQAHQMSGTLGRSVLAERIDVIQANLKRADELHTDSETTKKALSEALNSDASRAALALVDTAEISYRANLGKAITAIKGGDMDAARVALNDKPLLNAEANYLGALKTFENQQRSAMEHAQTQAELSFATDRNLLAGASLLAVALAVGLGIWITRSLLAQLGGEPEYAAHITQRISEGDLGVEVALRNKDQDSLLHAIQTMRMGFSDIVGRVRQGSESVATASTEIAESNQDLSMRTEQQASALQETSASMAELSSMVGQNAEDAQQASHLAQSASTKAVQGGAVVAEVVSTMKSIHESSRQISAIISVIEGISFQTNILALNAAVEAARAGEQGKGFAVVASEVRSLAGRSAQAAKEIKSLIDTSVERVQQGTILADQAGSAMTEVVSSIQNVSVLMGGISAASDAQSKGVAQVGQAVMRMDQVTQQNAALVEEMAAAASSLKSQAQELVQTVAVFKLDNQSQYQQSTAYDGPTRIGHPAPGDLSHRKAKESLQIARRVPSARPGSAHAAWC